MLCIELSGIVFNVPGQKKTDFSPTIFWEIYLTSNLELQLLINRTSEEMDSIPMSYLRVQIVLRE